MTRIRRMPTFATPWPVSWFEQTRSRVIDAFLQKVDWSDSAAGVAAVAPDLAGVDFEQALAAGSFSMVQSQVITTRGGDINIIAADHVDVGRSTFGSADSDSGIACQLSGDINIYSYGDINVNESRVITWYGGDITMWTDYGNINAGKGSTTASSSITSDYYYDEILEQWMVLRSIPVVGSGIRLLTNDPDGKAGPLGTAVAGAGYLFAPNGEIDASEAGIFRDGGSHSGCRDGCQRPEHRIRGHHSGRRRPKRYRRRDRQPFRNFRSGCHQFDE